jgi:hypothetical protein
LTLDKSAEIKYLWTPPKSVATVVVQTTNRFHGYRRK